MGTKQEKSTYAFDQLAASLDELLKSCMTEHGMEPPLFVGMVAANGSCAWSRYDGELNRMPVCLKMNPKGRFMPINVVIMDAKQPQRDAARMLMVNANSVPPLQEFIQ